LSTTSPKAKLDEFGSRSRYSPWFPTVQERPRSSLYATPIAPFGCRFAQKALKGSVTWCARPLESNSTFGSVLFVQLGGMSCVPVEMQSYPVTKAFGPGLPPGIEYEPRWKS
jgi:hypothetical protein